MFPHPCRIFCLFCAGSTIQSGYGNKLHTSHKKCSCSICPSRTISGYPILSCSSHPCILSTLLSVISCRVLTNQIQFQYINIINCDTIWTHSPSVLPPYCSVKGKHLFISWMFGDQRLDFNVGHYRIIWQNKFLF